MFLKSILRGNTGHSQSNIKKIVAKFKITCIFFKEHIFKFVIMLNTNGDFGFDNSENTEPELSLITIKYSDE